MLRGIISLLSNVGWRGIFLWHPLWRDALVNLILKATMKMKAIIKIMNFCVGFKGVGNCLRIGEYSLRLPWKQWSKIYRRSNEEWGNMLRAPAGANSSYFFSKRQENFQSSFNLWKNIAKKQEKSTQAQNIVRALLFNDPCKLLQAPLKLDCFLIDFMLLQRLNFWLFLRWMFVF